MTRHERRHPTRENLPIPPMGAADLDDQAEEEMLPPDPRETDEDE